MSTSKLLVSVARRLGSKGSSINAAKCSRHMSTAGGLPESIKRVGASDAFPNEYPGMDYAFNWALNGDGVTPTKESAFRLMKPLDVKIAGLETLSSTSLKVKGSGAMPEAGSDELSFDEFDSMMEKIKGALSSADHLYCPEGHAPGTSIGVRVITNSSYLAPSLLAYLDRAPKNEPVSQPVTCYVLDGSKELYSGYAIEIVEEGEESKSVAAVIVAGSSPSIEQVVAGIELSVTGIEADEDEAAEV